MTAINPELVHFRTLAATMPTKAQRDEAERAHAAALSRMRGWAPFVCMPATTISSICIQLTPYFIPIAIFFLAATISYFVYPLILDLKINSIKDRIQACFDAAILCDVKDDVETFFKDHGDICAVINIPEGSEVGTNACAVYESLANTCASRAAEKYFCSLRDEVKKKKATNQMLALTYENLDQLRSIIGADRSVKNNSDMLDQALNHPEEYTKGDCATLSARITSHNKYVEEVTQKTNFTFAHAKRVFEINNLAKICRYCPSALTIGVDCIIKVHGFSVEKLLQSGFSFTSWIERERR